MTAKLFLVALLFALLIFLSEHHYADGVGILLGILGAVAGLMVVLMLVGLKGKKTIRKIYILYAPEDAPFVSKLYDAMKVTPYKILWDKKEIHVGDHIEETNKRLLGASTDVIFVISRNTASPDWSAPAIAKVTQLEKRIFPVLIDQSDPPEELKEIMFADFRSSFDDGYFSLRDALKADRQDRPKPHQEKAASD